MWGFFREFPRRMGKIYFKEYFQEIWWGSRLIVVYPELKDTLQVYR